MTSLRLAQLGGIYGSLTINTSLYEREVSTFPLDILDKFKDWKSMEVNFPECSKERSEDIEVGWR
jgi:hypothetical protein